MIIVISIIIIIDIIIYSFSVYFSFSKVAGRHEEACESLYEFFGIRLTLEQLKEYYQEVDLGPEIQNGNMEQNESPQSGNQVKNISCFVWYCLLRTFLEKITLLDVLTY